MNDSQSSEVFSDCAGPGISPTSHESVMDYSFTENLFDNTLSLISKDVVVESQNPSFHKHFSKILEDSSTCVTQKLESICFLLEDPNIDILKLGKTMEDVINILQKLTNYIKNVMGVVSMSCSCVKAFPIMTGHILITVFTHCKESEFMYGLQLNAVEKQLKSLFRMCHDLQQVYLMILEKHFIFNMTNFEELDVFIGALEVNLKIGIIVQSLDLKTMAEQWKAYTTICERYSNYLLDRSVFQDCTKCLCEMVLKNIGIASEETEPKTVLRSLKVTNFFMKILMKMCHIFKHGVDKNFNEIVDLLIALQMQNEVHLTQLKKSPEYIQLVNTNVVNVTECLIKELLNDDAFLNCILHYDMNLLKNEDTLYCYTLLMSSILKSLATTNDATITDKWMQRGKRNLINSILDVLPCKIMYSTAHQHNIYEQILAYTAAVILSFTQEQYSMTEHCLYEALLGTNVYRGIFASDLWILLSRFTSRQLVFNQLVFLCKTYMKLERHPNFAASPQNLHLKYTFRRLFAEAPREEKLKICKCFSIEQEVNLSLWTALRIEDLSEGIRRNTEDVVLRQLDSFLAGNLMENDINVLVKSMRLAATSSSLGDTNNTVALISNCWLKLCLKNDEMGCNFKVLCKENEWFFDYVVALVELSNAFVTFIQQSSSCLFKVLHVLSNLTPTSSLEIKLILVNFILKLGPGVTEDELNLNLYHEILKQLFSEEEPLFRNYLLTSLQSQKQSPIITNVILKLINENSNLKEDWKYFKENGRIQAIDKSSVSEYAHKCLPSSKVVFMYNADSAKSDNFEFADLDSLLSMESDCEQPNRSERDCEQPVSKKVKLDSNEVKTVIDRLEKDISILASMKSVVGLESKSRILCLCEKLNCIFE